CIRDRAYSECVPGKPDFPRVKPWIGPMNLGFVILGLLYGRGDFDASLCMTVNCGEDADSTGSITGAIMGILHGYRAIPRKWVEPLGDRIETVTINRSNPRIALPRTTGELTERIVKLAPQILGGDICDYVNAEKGYTINMKEGEALFRGPGERPLYYEDGSEFPAESPCYPVRYEFPLFRAELQYLCDPFVLPGDRKRFRLLLVNNIRHQQWLNVTVHAPAGFRVLPAPCMNAFIDYGPGIMTNAQRSGRAAVEFELAAEAETLDRHRYDFFVDIVSRGRVSRGIVPGVLLQGGGKTLYHDVLPHR
ncbi:MAG: ADP-ribosylglycohydrolase family protein, partial [Planctomycetota bacterium]|nr:ADP-ribosylglycohydrolase family protein [Planctomycetota bacterium]